MPRVETHKVKWLCQRHASTRQSATCLGDATITIFTTNRNLAARPRAIRVATHRNCSRYRGWKLICTKKNEESEESEKARANTARKHRLGQIISATTGAVIRRVGETGLAIETNAYHHRASLLLFALSRYIEGTLHDQKHKTSNTVHCSLSLFLSALAVIAWQDTCAPTRWRVRTDKGQVVNSNFRAWPYC